VCVCVVFKKKYFFWLLLFQRTAWRIFFFFLYSWLKIYIILTFFCFSCGVTLCFLLVFFLNAMFFTLNFALGDRLWLLVAFAGNVTHHAAVKTFSLLILGTIFRYVAWLVASFHQKIKNFMIY
jgi:hypothetical protein